MNLRSLSPYRSVLLLCVTFGGTGQSAWAGLSACNPNPPGTTVTYNFGNSGSDALISPGGASGGCEQTNNEFSNFVYGAGGTTAGSSVTAQFTGSGEAATDLSVSGPWTGASGGNTPGFAFQSLLDPLLVPPPPNSVWSITGLNLSETGAIATASQVLIQILFCTNATTCDGGDTENGNFGELLYRLAGTTTINEACYNNGATGPSAPCATVGVSGSSSSFGVSLGLGAQSMFVEGRMLLLGAGTTASLSGLDLTFDQTAETPEPSSYVLMGSALAVLAFRLRRC